MTTIEIDAIAAQPPSAQDALLALNNAHARETSELTPAAWRFLVANAFSAVCIDTAALLIAFDQDAAYDNANFAWFRSRYDRFIYVDRIIVSASLRGQGAARALYDDLFARAGAAGGSRITCEVNLNPPNPGSDAFHAKMGFREVGQAHLADRAKTVRYLSRDLDAPRT